MKRLAQILSFSILMALSGLAAAEPPAGKDSEGFEPVQANGMVQQGESIPATQLVAAAYGFIWLAVMVYVLSVGRSADRTAREVAELKRRLDKQLGAGA